MTNSLADTTKVERAALESALRSLDARPSSFAKKRPLGLYLMVAILAGFATSWLDVALLAHPVVRAAEPLFALSLGAATAYLVLRSWSKAKWSFVGKYVDRAAIEARLRELGP